MAKTLTPAHRTVDAVDFDQINLAMQRGRVLRSQAFTTLLGAAYRRLIGRTTAERPAIMRGHRDCISAA